MMSLLGWLRVLTLYPMIINKETYMECSEPGAMGGEELIAYLDGLQVRPVAVQHLMSCQYCASQSNLYKNIERQLTRILYRWNCCSNQTLGEYHLGLLSPESVANVEEHLAECVLCAEDLALCARVLRE